MSGAAHVVDVSPLDLVDDDCPFGIDEDPLIVLHESYVIQIATEAGAFHQAYHVTFDQWLRDTAAHERTKEELKRTRDELRQVVSEREELRKALQQRGRR